MAEQSVRLQGRGPGVARLQIRISVGEETVDLVTDENGYLPPVSRAVADKLLGNAHGRWRKVEMVGDDPLAPPAGPPLAVEEYHSKGYVAPPARPDGPSRPPSTFVGTAPPELATHTVSTETASSRRKKV